MLARADYAELRVELEERRLLGLIGTRVQAAAEGDVPSEFAAAVAEARSRGRAAGLASEWITRALLDDLGRAGIRALPLKGPFLAQAAHGDLGLRESGDIDLLVASSDLKPAVDALVRAGYAPPHEPLRADGLPDLHFSLHHRRQPRVDLHWRVHWYETSFSFDMLARATPGNDGILRPTAVDNAVGLLLFYARDGFNGIRLAADLASWWERHPEQLPGSCLEAYSERYATLVPAMSAAARCAEWLTGVPAMGWLGRARRDGWRVDTAVRLASWSQEGDPDQLKANISLVSGILGPPRSLREFVTRELLTSDGSLATATHAAKMCLRYLAGLWRTGRGRNWDPAPPMVTLERR